MHSVALNSGGSPIPEISNELLIKPEEKRYNAKWEAWKYEILSIITLVVFAVLCIALLWCACIYAVEVVPLVVLGEAFLLQSFHTNIFHPYRQEAQKYWKIVAFEDRVIAKIASMKAEGIQEIETTCITARQKVYEDLATETLTKIQETFNAPSNYIPKKDWKTDGDWRTFNYQGYLEWYTEQPDLSDPNGIQKWLKTREWLDIKLSTRETDLYKRENEHLTYKVRAAFCAFVAENPVHHGSLEKLGTFLNHRDITRLVLGARRLRNAQNKKHDPFFLFYDGEKFLGRKMVARSSIDAIARLFSSYRPPAAPPPPLRARSSTALL